jgi:flagellar P-ring protein precursor FlgI
MFTVKRIMLLSALVSTLLVTSTAAADRIKDLTDVAGVRTNKLIGFGLVVGLQGSGDGKDLPLTAQG